MLRRSKSFKR